MIAGASIHRVSLSFGVRRRALAFMLILAMLVLLAFTAAAAEAATAPTFSRTDYATGLAPTWAEPGDVNGDGRLDLVVSNGNSDTLSLLLGNGSGGFAAATSLAAGGDGPFGVAIADLTGDGRKDLAVAHRYSNTLSLLAGDGAGGFTLLDSIAVGLDPISVKVDDLNEDGKRDLLVANMESAFLTALLGDGAGGFTRRDIPLARRGATVVGIADADDDGHLDLAVGHYFHNNVSVLLGDGTGAFILSRTLTVGTYPLGTAWADVDGDGDLDLCVASRSPGVAQADQVSVFPGDGEGGLGGATDYVVGWFAKVVLPKDLNLDGIVDLTTSSYWASSLSILSGRGDGSFDAQVTRSVGTSPHAVATADLNGDGRADLVAPNYEDDTVSVLLNTTPFQQLDVTPPLTTSSADSAWHTGAVTVTLTPSDAQSGVASTHFRLDGGAWQTGTSFSVSGEAVHAIQFYSVDVAGNTEATRSAQVKIDATAPVTTSSADSAWHTGAVTVTLTPSDAQSGVASTRFRLDGGAWQTGTSLSVSGNGVHTIQYYAVDKAGNTEVTKSAQVKIDAAAPLTTSSADGAWHTSAVTVTLSPSDTLSGVLSTYYRVDGAAWQTGTSFSVSGDGVHGIEFYAVDNAGNTEATKSAQVRIDGTAPSVTVTTPTDGASHIQGSVVGCAWTTTDSLSGVASETATIDGAGVAQGARIDTLPFGPHEFSVTVTDTAGNRRVVTVGYIIPVPHATSFVPASLVSTIPWSGSIVLRATLTDTGTSTALDGQVVQVEWSLDQTVWAPVDAAPTASRRGVAGEYEVTAAPQTRTYYRFSFAGDGAYASAVSRTILVSVRPVLSRPQPPTSAKAGRMFTVWGTLKPLFPPGAKTVTIKVTRFTGAKWVSYRTYKAMNADNGSSTRYSLRLKIPRRGKFRFKASTAATAQYATASTSYSRTMQIK